jgi:hypothetical protein
MLPDWLKGFMVGLIAGFILGVYRWGIYNRLYNFWLWRRWRQFWGENGASS